MLKFVIGVAVAASSQMRLKSLHKLRIEMVQAQTSCDNVSLRARWATGL